MLEDITPQNHLLKGGRSATISIFESSAIIFRKQGIDPKMMHTKFEMKFVVQLARICHMFSKSNINFTDGLSSSIFEKHRIVELSSENQVSLQQIIQLNAKSKLSFIYSIQF